MQKNHQNTNHETPFKKPKNNNQPTPKLIKLTKNRILNYLISSFKKLKNGQKFGNQARIDLRNQARIGKNQFTDEIRQKKVLKISKIAITSLI